MLSKTSTAGNKRALSATRERVRRFFGLDADALTNQQDHLHESATYFLERMGGPLAAWAAAAAARDDMTVEFGSWYYPGNPDAADEDDRVSGHSVLIFNKLYGVETTLPVRKSDVNESMHMFSAFFPRTRRERLDQREWVYEPLYGGLTDRGENAGLPRFIPRPAIMDKLTQTLMFEASSDFGWRALFYENNGDDPTDRFPTGIVALEGFLFKRVPYTHTAASGKTVEAFRAVDEDNVEVYAARVQQMIDLAPQLVANRQAIVGAPDQLRRRPRVNVTRTLPTEVRRQMDANAKLETPTPMDDDDERELFDHEQID